ncbi:MAG: amino acid transporter [Myxococcales bacterium]|nr:amino acid transporter [Myxococcales bacterium]
MRVMDVVFGKRLATTAESTERIGTLTGIPILGLDALSSAAYGPEAALTILLPLGAAGIASMERARRSAASSDRNRPPAARDRTLAGPPPVHTSPRLHRARSRRARRPQHRRHRPGDDRATLVSRAATDASRLGTEGLTRSRGRAARDRHQYVLVSEGVTCDAPRVTARARDRECAALRARVRNA